MPAEYRRTEGILKKISATTDRLILSPQEAMFEYLKLCRSLPSNGVTLFTVKEKKDEKDILIGMSTTTIVVLNAETKVPDPFLLSFFLILFLLQERSELLSFSFIPFYSNS